MIDENSQQVVFQSAMTIAAAGRWAHCRLSEIADNAGVDAEFLERTYGDKAGLLRAFAGFIDSQVLSDAGPDLADPAVSTRERLLEILMLRFDALEPYKQGVARLLRSLPGDPRRAGQGAVALDQSMRAALDAVGVSSAGLCGRIRAQGLTAVFLAGLATWVGDDSPDLAATQRVLDARLKQAESVARSLGLLTVNTSSKA